MLGESVGNQWIARVEGEEAIYGQGNVALVVTRSGDGETLLLDIIGSLSIFLPLGGGERRSEGVEAMSFDLRSANQPVELDGPSGTVSVYAEIMPRRRRSRRCTARAASSATPCRSLARWSASRSRSRPAPAATPGSR